MKPLALLLLILATATQAEEGRWYNAQDTLRRAQVGTYSPRLAPPVKVETKGKPAQQHRFERLRCYVDPADRLRRAIICEPKDSDDE